jgi:hypothetical protein
VAIELVAAMESRRYWLFNLWILNGCHFLKLRSKCHPKTFELAKKWSWALDWDIDRFLCSIVNGSLWL